MFCYIYVSSQHYSCTNSFDHLKHFQTTPVKYTPMEEQFDFQLERFVCFNKISIDRVILHFSLPFQNRW